MNVICMSDDAFYALIDQVVARLKSEDVSKKNKWVSDREAMALLNIKSKTTLQKYRDQGLIEFTQAGVKLILYNVDSIMEFHERNKKDGFKSYLVF